MSRPTNPQYGNQRSVADRFVDSASRFLHVEALSGIVLICAAVAAMTWANFAAGSYQQFWSSHVRLGIGNHEVAQSLRFLVNDGLMTFFFLVVGMEIRREIFAGALATWRLAALPLVAAVGGIVFPAIIYLAFNTYPELRSGWAVPTATDIAFAVGVLALLGKAVPAEVRILLLALAIIDDIAAVLAIAFFYSDGVQLIGVGVAAIGIIVVLIFQRLGVRSAVPYLLPGATIWLGMLSAGIHPTLAGVALGLLTPVRPASTPQVLRLSAERLSDIIERQMAKLRRDAHVLEGPLRHMRVVQRELLPPVERVQMRLHPWVAYGVMPIFALANAGITLDTVDLQSGLAASVLSGVAIALVLGKPLGIIFFSWVAVRIGWCSLPRSTTWRGVLLVGCLGGIGFTMSIFIAALAFESASLLAAAKAGILLGSLVAGVLGLVLGWLLFRRSNTTEDTR